MKTELRRYANGAWDGPLPPIDGDSTLVLAFGASGMIREPEAIRELVAAFPRSTIAGCSSSGEIYKSQVADDTLAVAVTRFEHTSLRRASTTIEAATESFEAGEKLARELAGPGLKYVLVLSDGIHVNGTELVRGLNSVFGPDVIVTGGLAGDGPHFEATWVIDGGEPRSHRIVAVAFYGDRLTIGHGSQGGWDIFGPERIVTRSEGNVLFELNGAPALDLYKTYLGERASGLPATCLLFPLAIRADEADENRLVRTILAVDEERNALIFAGDVPAGHRAQFMKANFDRLVMGASDAASLTTGAGTKGPALAIAISCVGRRLVLGERTEEEVEATLDVLPPGTQQVGFYSYGELSPVAAGTCDLHNQTMTLTALWEH